MTRNLIILQICAALTLCLPGTASGEDNQRAFDIMFGTWNTSVQVLQAPLSGEEVWLEFEGTTIVHDFLDGRANLAELSVEGAAGRIEGVSLRLYNPQTGEWNMNYAGIRSGILTEPLTGSFSGGRGEFHSRQTFNGQPIIVRFVISDITENSVHFEQAFSPDDGVTWETNWIAIDTRD